VFTDVLQQRCLAHAVCSVSLTTHTARYSKSQNCEQYSSGMRTASKGEVQLQEPLEPGVLLNSGCCFISVYRLLSDNRGRYWIKGRLRKVSGHKTDE